MMERESGPHADTILVTLDASIPLVGFDGDFSWGPVHHDGAWAIQVRYRQRDLAMFMGPTPRLDAQEYITVQQAQHQNGLSQES